MPKLYISYRRADSSAMTGRIADSLTQAFGHDSVFLDVSSIPLGVDFRDYIQQIIAQTSVMLVIIGPQWLIVTDQSGRRRIDDTSDSIRIEIESALRTGIAILPILIEGARMPSVAELPASIAQLAYFNAAMVRYDPSFVADMRRLIGVIGAIEGSKVPSQIPAAPVTPEVPSPSTDLIPGSARQQELQDVAARNVRIGKPPYFSVELATRGELRWIMDIRSWSGAPEAGEDHRADFSGAVIVAPNLAGIALFAANLAGATLERVNLAGADLREANLDSANLSQANLSSARLQQASMNLAGLEAADLSGADLTAANLNNAKVSLANLGRATLNDTKLNNVDLSTANLAEANLNGADLRDAILHDMDLRGIYLDGAALIAADLSGADLRNASLNRAVLERAHLESTNLGGAVLDGANLMGAILEGTDLSGTSLRGTLIESVSVLSNINFDGRTQLDRVAWGGIVLKEQKVARSRRERIAMYRNIARQNRRIAVALRAQGLLADASKYRLKEQRMERRAALWEGKVSSWAFSGLLDLVAGYGEQPVRAVRAYLVIVVGFALAYMGVTHFLDTKLTQLSWDEALVLSLTSFHGRGFFPGTLPLGDWVARFAAGEAVIGLFIELVFIATFSRRFLGN